jgi:hypothetical protein
MIAPSHRARQSSTLVPTRPTADQSMADFLAERTRLAELERQQELVACELAHSDIGVTSGAVFLKWFTTSLLWRPERWMPMVCMGLLDQNKAGELRWRIHPRPLKLVNWIASCAAWKWAPELHFRGDDHAADQATRPHEVQMGVFQRTNPGAKEDERSDYNSAEASFLCGVDGNHPRGYRPRGIPIGEDDLDRARFVDNLVAFWSVPPGSGWDRPPDPPLFNPDQLVGQALQRAAMAGAYQRRVGRDYLLSQLAEFQIKPVTAAAILRVYDRDFSLFRSGRDCDLGEDDPLSEDQREALDHLDIPAVARQRLLEIGFSGDEGELVFHKLCGVGREELKTMRGWEDTVDDDGRRHSKVEAIWRAVNRRLKDPGVDKALRKAMSGDLSGIEQQREERRFLTFQAKFMKTQEK